MTTDQAALRELDIRVGDIYTWKHYQVKVERLSDSGLSALVSYRTKHRWDTKEYPYSSWVRLRSLKPPKD